MSHSYATPKKHCCLPLLEVFIAKKGCSLAYPGLFHMGKISLLLCYTLSCTVIAAQSAMGTKNLKAEMEEWEMRNRKWESSVTK